MVASIAKEIETTHLRLCRAINRGSRLRYSLKLWSEFIRIRDGKRCVLCGDGRALSAHHICRRSFFAEAQLMTGNGITLCSGCHKEAHAGFNGRPNLQLPMDAQGGEKIDLMTELYGELCRDARERGLLGDRYYFLSDSILCKFKLFQGFDPFTYFPGCGIEQAHVIWLQTPQRVKNALLEANGFAPSYEPILPGVTIREAR